MNLKSQKFILINWIITIISILGMLTLMAVNVFTKDANDIFKSSYESIVEVKAYSDTNSASYGTGVIVTKDGNIITNAHVVLNVDEEVHTHVEVRFANKTIYEPVDVVRYDKQNDLALLKLDGDNFKYIKSSTKYDYGDKVYAIGNANNLGLSITEGIIANPKLQVNVSGFKRTTIQCDLTINDGNSGGALLDKRGRLIGITTFRMKDGSGQVIQGLSYSVPIEIVENFYKFN